MSFGFGVNTDWLDWLQRHDSGEESDSFELMDSDMDDEMDCGEDEMDGTEMDSLEEINDGIDDGAKEYDGIGTQEWYLFSGKRGGWIVVKVYILWQRDASLLLWR